MVGGPAGGQLAPSRSPAGWRGGGKGLRLYERLWDTGLLNVAAISRRDLQALLGSPVVYLAGAAAIVPVSIFGYLSPVTSGQPVSLAGVFSWVAAVMAVGTPLVTMRLLAAQEASGALGPVLASPVRFWELVVGKWLAGLALYLAMVAVTLGYVALVSVFQRVHGAATVAGLHLSLPAVGYGAIVTGYLGAILVGAAWVALGLLASSLTRHQVVAAAAGVAVLLALQYLFGAAAGAVAPPVADVLAYLSASRHAQSFDQGQLALRDVVYFVTLAAGGLFLAAQVAGFRRSLR